MADAMLAEATFDISDRVFSATGFASENISIVHQQTRTANLAWALKRRGKVGAGDVVAVIGGSFSGIMVAAALALTTDAIVYIFEKGPHLLPRFRDKGHRHLSPVLNSRGLGEHFDPSYSGPTFRSPIFAWDKGPASEVAAQWLREFADYYCVLPIFSICNTSIGSANLRPHATGVEIAWDRAVSTRVPIAVDLVIDATGFGEEANPHRLIDFSYWESGHRLTYDHVVPPADVLISGCGDSGVIEALHYALNSFRHEEVEAFWPPYQSFGLVLDQLVDDARLPDVLGAEPNIDFENPLVSEVCWWLDISYHLRKNPDPIWPLDSNPHTRPIFAAISGALAGDLDAAFPGRPLAKVSYEKLEEFAKNLPRDRQFAVRDTARPVIEDWISRRLETAVANIELPPNLREIHNLARKGVTLTLNGRTPTPYTRQLSPYNVWVMRILMSFPNVRYLQGAIESVTSRSDRRLVAKFADSSRRDYDRLLTRYGAGGGVAVATAARRDGLAGDALLANPHYSAADPRDGRDKFWLPVREDLLCCLDTLVPVPTSSLDMSKNHYVRSLVYGPDAVSAAAGLPADPQAALKDDLRNGRRPTYGKDALTARALR
ncbi:MAG: hypothetical protein WC729_20310 [Sphingomonas sp.]|uniref:hypothetical protein n=1 Tax=Sphingomonas sp. TaxID=28214 RepID=UPI003564156E